MDGPGEYHAKWSKPVIEDKHHYDFTHMWTLMNKLNQQAKQRQTHRWRVGTHLVGGKWEGGGIEQKGKRTHGHGQQCGDYRGQGIKELHGNGKNTIFFKFRI